MCESWKDTNLRFAPDVVDLGFRKPALLFFFNAVTMGQESSRSGRVFGLCFRGRMFCFICDVLTTVDKAGLLNILVELGRFAISFS